MNTTTADFSLEQPAPDAGVTSVGVGSSALLGICDTCGGITAIDMDGTPENAREMAMPGRTVRWVSKIEARLRAPEMKRCDHKKLIEDPRRMARIA
jgi:hypothetical protein